MGVLAIWRYPVKAMLGELLEAVAIGPRGCEGDRRWIVVDAASGERIANKRGPTDPRLRACPIHLITTGTLAHLRALAPGSDWDVRRFRPNLLLDDGATADPFGDALLGGHLQSPSGLKLTIGLPTPRCVVPTRAQDGLAADPAILRTIVDAHRVDLGPFGRQGCAGAYAEVANAGRLRTGERFEVRRGDAPPRAAIDRAVARVRDHA